MKNCVTPKDAVVLILNTCKAKALVDEQRYILRNYQRMYIESFVYYANHMEDDSEKTLVDELAIRLSYVCDDYHITNFSTFDMSNRQFIDCIRAVRDGLEDYLATEECNATANQFETAYCIHVLYDMMQFAAEKEVNSKKEGCHNGKEDNSKERLV